MSTTDKVRENRARRAVARQGGKLVKIRRRDPRAVDYGMYRIERRPGRYSGSGLERLRKILEVPKNPGPYTLDDVEAWLER